MKLTNLLLIFCFLAFSCSSSDTIVDEAVKDNDCVYSKIKFDFLSLDERGLNSTNKAIDFEFCIPNHMDQLMEVKNIDSSLKSQKGKGRSNCSENYLLIVGSTYNKNYKKILCKLSQLDYVKEINESFWE